MIIMMTILPIPQKEKSLESWDFLIAQLSQDLMQMEAHLVENHLSPTVKRSSTHDCAYDARRVAKAVKLKLIVWYDRDSHLIPNQTKVTVFSNQNQA